MKPVTAERTEDRVPAVLVLGGAPHAQRLAEGLKASGLDPVLEGDLARRSKLAPAVESAWAAEGTEDPAVGSMRELLGAFSKGAQGRTRYLHPGVSAWAARPELPALAQEAGVAFIGPSPKVLSLFANKLALLSEADRLGIPNLLLSFEPIQSAREVQALIGTGGRGLPIVLKSVRGVPGEGGGAGAGVRVIRRAEDLGTGLRTWLEQLRGNYGEAILFAERYLEGARLVSFAFARLPDGTMEYFPPVDGSLQASFRKIVEFCPFQAFESGVEERVRGWISALAASCSFSGVGVLDFLVDGSRAYLVQGMAGLNRGFPLWERIHGTRAVSWQMAAVEGGKKPSRAAGPEPRRWESGLAIRLYAEDPVLQLPQPGFIREMTGPSRWERDFAEAVFEPAVREGTAVDPGSDGMLGVLACVSAAKGKEGRDNLVSFTRQILREIWIAGSLQTNERFLSELLEHPWVREGITHAGFVEEEFLPTHSPPDGALAAAATACAWISPPSEGDRWVAGRRPVEPDLARVPWEGKPERWIQGGFTGVSGTISDDGRKIRICAFPTAEGRWQVRAGEWTISVRRLPPASKVPKTGTLPLASLVTGRVHSVLYQPGTDVPAHEPVVIVESLRTLVAHSLPVPVKVESWSVRAEDQVGAGQTLGVIRRLDR